MRAMSTRWRGCARRSFRIGSRLWPPESSLASSPYCWIRPSASFTEVARWYSNSDGYMALGLLCCIHRAPDFFRLKRHVELRDAERTQRVEHRVDHAWRRADRAGLADALDPQRVERRRRHG